MSEELASTAWEGKLGRATGRVLLGNNQYATIAVTCHIRASQAASGTELEELGEQYLATASTYALQLGRFLADGGTPPTRIEVDADCQLERVAGEPRLSDLALDVRGEVLGSDQATFEAAARESSLLQSVWGALPTATVSVVASLVGSSTTRPQPLRELDHAVARPAQRGVHHRPRVLRRLTLLVLLCAALLAFVLVRDPGLLDIFGAVVPGQAVRPSGSGPAAAAVGSVSVAGSQVSAAPIGSSTPTSITLPAASATPLPPVAIAPTERPTTTPSRVPPTFTPTPLLLPSPTLTSTSGTGARFDETFVNNARQWPNNSQSTAWLGSGGYSLATRQAAQFVAVRAPATERFGDVRVTGVFRKVGGPPGGGYGLIVRDQSQPPLDGISQSGSYYVFEVGDKGDVGMWRRAGDQWVDLLSWTPSAAVHPGDESNELVAQVRGSQLQFTVNGLQVASQEDTALADGGVGVFVGGDGNDVVLSRLTVERLN
jgi:hypothetical protein